MHPLFSSIGSGNVGALKHELGFQAGRRFSRLSAAASFVPDQTINRKAVGDEYSSPAIRSRNQSHPALTENTCFMRAAAVVPKQTGRRRARHETTRRNGPLCRWPVEFCGDRSNVVLAWRVRIGGDRRVGAVCTVVHGNQPVLVRGESALLHNSLGEQHTGDTDGLLQTTVTHDSPLKRVTLAGVSSWGRPINALMSLRPKGVRVLI